MTLWSWELDLTLYIYFKFIRRRTRTDPFPGHTYFWDWVSGSFYLWSYKSDISLYPLSYISHYILGHSFVDWYIRIICWKLDLSILFLHPDIRIYLIYTQWNSQCFRFKILFIILLRRKAGLQSSFYKSQKKDVEWDSSQGLFFVAERKTHCLFTM